MGDIFLKTQKYTASSIISNCCVAVESLNKNNIQPITKYQISLLE